MSDLKKTDPIPWKLFLILLLFPVVSKSQYWIAGDTTGYVKILVEKTYEPNIKVVIDIDCDGKEDFSLISSKPVGPSWPWSRLSIIGDSTFEVLNSGIGKVSIFDLGDTLLFDDSVWTPYLDFIYGTGKLGSYGHYQIDEKYIAFRKSSVDTNYCFLRFSNTGIVFTIHEIISGCSINPIDVIVSVEKLKPGKFSSLVYPNPANNQLFIKGKHIEQVELYDVFGKAILSEPFHSNSIDLMQLPAGLYHLIIFHDDGEREFLKIVKQ
jgi:type IX secretion system substrate protein